MIFAVEILVAVALLAAAAGLGYRAYGLPSGSMRRYWVLTAAAVVAGAVALVASASDLPGLRVAALLALLPLGGVAAVAAWRAGGIAHPREADAATVPQSEAPAPEGNEAPEPTGAPDETDQEARLAEFVYMISHDLQEPLRMVIGFGQLLERRYSERLDEQGREFLRMSTSSATRMSNMLGDLLRLSRIEQADVAEADVPLDQTLAMALARLRKPIEESGAEIVAEDLPTVRGNKALLSDAFQEIISNSLKYRSEQAPVVRVRCQRRDGVWEISFEDNGIGFEPRFAARIFKPFQRLHAVDEYPGTGMGLALVKRIVERHGGSVAAEANVEQPGSRFVVRLPG